jgi:aminoglycoside phosphotransferase (APT) family kinase protein
MRPRCGDGDLSPSILKECLEKIFKKTLAMPVPVADMGKFSQAYNSKLEDEDIVINTTRGRNSYPAEIWVYEKLSYLGVPVPSVMFYCESLPLLSIPCLVISRIAGETLASIKLRKQYEKDVYGMAGKILGKIHSIRLTGTPYGYGAFATDFSERFDCWEDFLFRLRDIPRTIQRLADDVIDIRYTDYLNRVAEDVVAHRFESVLIHGDLGPDHLFILKGKIVGVIDPGNSFAGPPEYDLAYFGVYVNPIHLRYALDQYVGHYEMDKVNHYMCIISAHKAIRAHEVGDYNKRDFFINVLARISALSY